MSECDREDKKCLTLKHGIILTLVNVIITTILATVIYFTI